MSPYTTYDYPAAYDSGLHYDGDPIHIVFHVAQTSFDTIVEVVSY